MGTNVLAREPASRRASLVPWARGAAVGRRMASGMVLCCGFGCATVDSDADIASDNEYITIWTVRYRALQWRQRWDE